LGPSGGAPEFVGVYPSGSNWYVVTTYEPKKLQRVSPALVTTAATTTSNMRSFAVAPQGSDEVLYYCAYDGVLYARNLTTPTSPAEQPVSLEVPGAICSGSTLLHRNDGTSDYLMTVYQQNGLEGIMELTLSP
jgi:hypothetical protein